MTTRKPQENGTAPTDGKSVKTKEQRTFDEALHSLLIVGLIISVVLILIGLALTLINHQSLPDQVLSPGTIFSNISTLEPSGFFSLGLLVLIATPIFRVFTSFITFLIESDWRFAGITLVVLITVIVSILLGKY